MCDILFKEQWACERCSILAFGLGANLRSLVVLSVRSIEVFFLLFIYIHSMIRSNRGRRCLCHRCYFVPPFFPCFPFCGFGLFVSVLFSYLVFYNHYSSLADGWPGCMYMRRDSTPYTTKSPHGSHHCSWPAVQCARIASFFCHCMRCVRTSARLKESPVFMCFTNFYQKANALTHGTVS